MSCSPMSSSDHVQPNLYVDGYGSIQIGGFGRSAVHDVESRYEGLPSGLGWAWTAPELMAPGAFGFQLPVPTRASDIYSFACICVEVSMAMSNYMMVEVLI